MNKIVQNEPNRVIQGLWQASDGHSNKSHCPETFFEQIEAYRVHGLSTLDFGDIYLGVEKRVGEYIDKLRQNGKNEENSVRLHTKYVPDKGILTEHNSKNVQAIVERSRQRLQVDEIDLVQFHWWDYSVPKYTEALSDLFELREQGQIRQVGITNFDTTRVQEFIREGLSPYSIQLQYSLLDRRPENGMLELCRTNGIKVFCYGTVAGGFLSEKYLNCPEPSFPYENRSLIKYKLIIDEIGGWDTFQSLLRLLKAIANRYQCDISTIASAYILQNQGVEAVIIGVRNNLHLDQHLKIRKDLLQQTEIDMIRNFLANIPGPKGDVYDLERNNEKHAGIMHTNNNKKD